LSNDVDLLRPGRVRAGSRGVAVTLRIGTRGSALARAQSTTIAESLAAKSGQVVELVVITTAGDRSAESLATIGGTGVFATALREALLADECDLLVHSLKDLPTAAHPGLVVAAIPRRADARDALCARDGLRLVDLPLGARVGTGSPRRAAQLRAARADLTVVDVRGNVDTRLGKVASGELDAVVLAKAGLDRLGRAADATEVLELSDWPTAPGQGALAIEVRAGSEKLVAALDHKPSRLVVESERLVLTKLEAGCLAPVGASAVLDDGLLFLSARVYSSDGTAQLTSSHALYPSDSTAPADELAGKVARELFDLGAADLTGALQ
jgi:hydroxymethylbilane synthase